VILTLEEKRAIARMTINSHYGGLLIESKTDRLVREDLRFNLKFYNAVKETFSPQLRKEAVITEDLLTILGNIKDLLTGVKFIDDIVKWISDKFLPILVSKIDQFIPKNVQDIASKLGNNIKSLISWLEKNLSYKGLTKLFAMIKYKTFSPNDEQMKCMELSAKSAYRYILMTLVAAFIIKVVGYGAETFVDVFTSDQVLVGSMDQLMASIGLGKLFTTLFGTYGAATKAQKAVKLKKDIETKRTQVQNDSIIKFKADWAYCDSKEQQ
jgi:uncharacterized protein YfkK (UPF0435 family)